MPTAGRIFAVNSFDFVREIPDFVAGAGGDRLDYGDQLARVLAGRWDPNTNPFAAGFLRLLQQGDTVVLQLNARGKFDTIVVFDGAALADFTADNFFGYAPDGSAPVATHFTGGTGADVAFGSYLADDLAGGDGNDTLTASRGDDHVDGGTGDDRLDGGSGDDTLIGGIGNDAIEGGAGADTLDGGDGDDVLSDAGGSGTLDGGAGADRITLSHTGLSAQYRTAETIAIKGGDGNDAVLLETNQYRFNDYNRPTDFGTVAVDLGAGDDLLEIGILSPTARIVLGDGRDRVIVDTVTADWHSDASVIRDFKPGAGGDLLDLTRLFQGLDVAGNPFASGALTLTRAGADTVVSVLTDGNLRFRITLSGVEPTTLTADNLAGYAPDGSAAAPRSLVGTVGDDTLDGATADDVLNGGRGNDAIRGYAGDDQLIGGVGNDRLDAGDGDDIVDGGDGDDVIVERLADADRLTGGAGNDQISAATNSIYDPDVRLLVSGGDGDDAVSLQIIGGKVTVDLGAGDDLLSVGYFLTDLDGRATLGAGVDTLRLDQNFGAYQLADRALHVADFQTGVGGDVLDWRDYVTGARYDISPELYNPFAYNDAELVQSGADTILTFRGGVVAVFENTQAGAFVDANLGFDLDAPSPPGETFIGTNATELWRGTKLADTADLLGGDDQGYGDAGDDTLRGGDGDDRLFGDDGDDLLQGGAGKDFLYGVAGRDRIEAGDGDDTIIFSDSLDTIDGGAGSDVFDLSYWDAGKGTVDLDLRNFTVGHTFLLGGNLCSGIETVLFRQTFDSVIALSDGDDRLLFGADWTSSAIVDGGDGDDMLMSGIASSALRGSAGDDQLFGLGAVDTLEGGTGNDRLAGGGSGDRLSGGTGNDVIAGDDGNDQISTGTGVDHIDAGAGDDVVTDEQFDRADVLAGGDGVDTLTLVATDALSIDLSRVGAGGPVLIDRKASLITGFERFTLVLGDGDDAVRYAADYGVATTIAAGGGNDRLTMGAGADAIDGGAGADVIDGGAGDDRMTGGLGDDIYYLLGADTVVEAANGGYDRVYAASSYALAAEIEEGALTGSAALTLRGNALSNVLTGNTGANILSGSAGNDRIDGRTGFDTVDYSAAAGRVVIDLRVTAQAARGDGDGGSDTLISIEGVIGSAGGDQLTGADAANRLFGGAGDDRLDGGYGNDVLDGGDGVDTVSYAAFAGGVRVDLGAGRAAYGTRKIDQLSSIESVIGTAFGDRIVAGRVAVTLDGGGGNDQLVGGIGADTLLGGDGNDTLAGNGDVDRLDGGAGADRLAGGDGNDTIDGGAGNDRIDGGAGIDTVVCAAAATGGRIDLVAGRAAFGSEVDALANVENVVGSAFGDTIVGADAGGRLDGGAGDDMIQSGRGDDVLIGGAGVDTLSYARATSGVTITLGDGAYATGGGGADTISGFENLAGSAFADTLTGSQGVNVLDGGAGDDVLVAVGRCDTVIGGAGIDTLDASGALAAVTINLGVAGPQATGVYGSMTVSGIEAVAGTNYNDTLTGGAGNDTLGGGLGNDTLTGGAGADQFVFASVGDVDTITDFAHGVDKIYFPGSVAGLPVGVLPDGMFRAGTEARDADDRVIYDQNTGTLLFDVDGVGGYDAFLVATISNHAALSASDFVVI